MSVVVVEPPVNRSSGRRPRLSDEDFQDLANALKEGKWVSDDERVDNKSAAYQRAQAAAKVMHERFGFENVPKTTAFEAEPGKPEAGYLWAIGPRPEGERLRRKRGTPQS